MHVPLLLCLWRCACLSCSRAGEEERERESEQALHHERVRQKERIGGREGGREGVGEEHTDYSAILSESERKEMRQEIHVVLFIETQRWWYETQRLWYETQR